MFDDTSDTITELEKKYDIDEERKKYITGGLTGLVNIGNTCYMNSALQCLFATDLLTAYFLKKTYVNDLKHGIANKLAEDFRKTENLPNDEVIVIDPDIIRKKFKKSVMYKLRALFLIAWNENCKLKPVSFKKKFGEACEKIFKTKSFKRYSQEDSSEFIGLLLDILHEESKTSIILEYNSLPQELEKYIDTCNKYENKLKESDAKNKDTLMKKYEEYKKSNPNLEVIKKAHNTYIEKIKNNHSAIIDIFTGMSMSIINCNDCNNKTHTFELFNMINLPIPNKNNQTLYDCFDKFTETEILLGDNKYSCECCNNKVIAQKNMTFWNMPNRLIIHLKRFDNFLRKNDTTVKFPIEGLNLQPYINDPFIEDHIYDLYGIVHHSGMSLGGGHYIAYVKNMINNKWYLCNDSDILHIDTERIEKLITSGAYILFYKKRGDAMMAKEFDEQFDV